MLNNPIFNRNRVRKGIELGDVKVLVHVQLRNGSVHQFGGDGMATAVTQWADAEVAVPYQVVLADIKVSADADAVGQKVQTKDVFLANQSCVLTDSRCYGALGKVRISHGIHVPLVMNSDYIDRKRG